MSLEKIVKTEALPGAPVLDSSLGNYVLKEMISPTTHGWLFHAKDSKLDRDVAVKVLSPTVKEGRKRQFITEGTRLAQLDIKHPGIVAVYSAGEERGYNYLVMEYIEGETLEKKLKEKSISPKKAREMIISITDSLSFCHQKGIYHGDIKPANIIEKEDGKIVIIDFGSKLSLGSVNEDYSEMEIIDLECASQVARQILSQIRKKNNSRRLEKLLNESGRDKKYKTVRELNAALQKDGRKINRRKFLSAIGCALGATALCLFGGREAYIWHGELKDSKKYRDSPSYIVDQIRNANSQEEEKLREELLYRLLDQKIRFVATKKIKPSEYPMGSHKNEWFVSKEPHYSNGFWPGILIEGYKLVKDEEFLNLARKWTDSIAIMQEDEEGITGLRFYYSHAAFYDSIRKEEHKLKALQAADILVKRFRRDLNFIPIKNTENEEVLFASTISDVVPFLWWAYTISGDNRYFDTAYKHAQSVIRLNIHSNGSVIEQAIIDPQTQETVGERTNGGLKNNSIVARVQAQTLVGLLETFQNTQDPQTLEKALAVGDFFVNNLPPDLIPYYEFGELPDEYKKRDSSAAAIGAYGLINLSRFSPSGRYKEVGRKIRRTLILDYLSSDNTHSGLLKHGCLNLRRPYYDDSSLIFGDYYFIKLLNQE